MKRLKCMLARLNKKTRRLSNEEQYLANSDSLVMLEYRQKQIQLGLAPFQKYNNTKYFI